MSLIATCPILKRGEDFDAKGKWPVVTKRPISAMMGRDLGAIYEFWSGDLLLARHDHGELTLLDPFASDGYSPVLSLPCGRFIYLTPWPKCGVWPALGHDLTRQFISVKGCPWTRKDTDVFFYEWLVAGGVNRHVAGIYYGAVAGRLGNKFIELTRYENPLLHINRIEYGAAASKIIDVDAIT